MKNLSILAAFCFMIASCSQGNNDNIAFRISEKDLIPEGITYSSATNSFYLGSIHKTKIIQIDAETGVSGDFIPSGLTDLSFLGLIVDDSNKYLWACGFRYENNGTSSLVSKFDLNTGILIKTYSFKDTVQSIYNDLASDKAGNIFFTDSDGQCVYKIDRQTDSVSLFFDGIEILHPNGITISPDNKYLYVASTNYGIRVLDIKSQTIADEYDTLFNSRGIDGLKYYKSSLIGIQNEVKTRSEVKIAQYFLDETGTMITGMKIIDQNNPLFDIPTTFVIAENQLYCLANSQLDNLSHTGQGIVDPEELNDILILKYKMKQQK